MAGRVDQHHPALMGSRSSFSHSLHRINQSYGCLAMLIIPTLFLVLFYAEPVLEIFKKSFTISIINQGGIKTWQTIVSTLGFTTWQAVLSTFCTLLLGLPAAYVLYRYKFPGQGILRTLTAIPFILPTVVVAAGLNALIGSHGWVNLILQQVFHLDAPPVHLIGTLSAIILAHIFYNLTIIIRLVGNAWSGLNPKLEMAARTLGANSWQTFWRITLPLLRPVLTAAVILVFLFDFTSFGVILLLGGPQFATLEVEVYRQTMSLFNLPLASILALLQMTATLGLTITYQFFASRPVPLVPADDRENQVKPVKASQKIFIIVTVIVLVVLVLSPLVSLAGRSVYRAEGDRGQRASITTGFTFDYYQALFTNPRMDLFYVPPVAAIANSIKYGLVTALISLILGMLIVYGLRKIVRGRKVIDALLMLPLGTSAVTLGLGYVIFFNKPPFFLGGSQWLIPMAHSLVALPFVVRGLSPAVESIPRAFRQSAATLGASPLRVFWQIDLPIIRRAVFSAMVFAFTISLGEFGATSFLTRPDYPTIPVAIFRFLSQPGGLNYGQAMAMATILMLVCAAGIIFFEQSFFLVQKGERL